MNLNHVFEKFGIVSLPIDQILKLALQRGGDWAELFFEETTATRLVLEDQLLDRVSTGVDRGVGLRVLYQGRSVYGYTTEGTEAALRSLAKTLSEAVGDLTVIPSEQASVVDWKQVEGSPIQSQSRIRSITLPEKLQLLKRAEASARQECTIAQQVTVALIDSCRKILIFNSKGEMAQDEKHLVQMGVQVVGQHQGHVETAYESQGAAAGFEFFEQHSPETIGQLAAQRLKVLLSARPAPSGTMPVVLASEAGGTMIHEAVGHGLEADLACQGLSVYENQLGKKVAASFITVIDDGTLMGRRGSYQVDDEGTPAQRTVLIEEGILKSYLVDQLSSMKFHLRATGNGRRESFRYKPIVRMTNTFIAPGQEDPQSIIAETQWGLFVKAMGGGQVNTVTGDFVFAVTEGYWIEKGQLVFPVRGATLVGNGPQVLLEIDRLGKDLGFATGTCGKEGQAAPVTDAQPTLRIPSLTVGGEVPLETYLKDA